MSDKKITASQVEAATTAYIEACKKWDEITDPLTDDKPLFAYRHGVVDGMKAAYETVGLIDDVLKEYQKTSDTPKLEQSKSEIGGPCYACKVEDEI